MSVLINPKHQTSGELASDSSFLSALPFLSGAKAITRSMRTSATRNLWKLVNVCSREWNKTFKVS